MGPSQASAFVRSDGVELDAEMLGVLRKPDAVGGSPPNNAARPFMPMNPRPRWLPAAAAPRPSSTISSSTPRPRIGPARSYPRRVCVLECVGQRLLHDS
jgi:hypothetical protein